MTFDLYWQLKVYAFIFGIGVVVGMYLMYLIMKNYPKDTNQS